MPVQQSDTLKSRYAEQVSDDLKQNTAEQERIREEIDSRQKALSGLEKDHELLVGMRAVLGDTTAVPGPRRTEKKTAAKKTSGKTASAKAPSAKKPAGLKPDAGKKDPSLVELSHQYLSRQTGPVTVGEIAKDIAAAHPKRKITNNNVRTATEALVARSRAERSIQGSTVFYTSTEADNSETTTVPAGKEPLPADA